MFAIMKPIRENGLHLEGPYFCPATAKALFALYCGLIDGYKKNINLAKITPIKVG